MPLVEEDQIRSLLADGSITAMTVDTSIFDEKQLQLSSATLQALASFKDRPFDFLLADTVAKEVLAHLRRASEDALQAAKKGIGQALNAFETHNPTRDELLTQISGGRTAEEAAKQRWDKFIADTGCEVLADSSLVATATLFEAYFSGQPPFGSGRKKDEFPDALALNALERTAADRGKGILVVSKDGDWRSFCEQSKRLYLVPEIERALHLVTNAPLGLRKAIFAWMTVDGEGHEEISERLGYKVEQLEFSVNGYPTQGEVELSAWAGVLQSIEWPDEADIDIIEVEELAEDRVLRVVVSLPLEMVVRVMVELSFSFWDSIDKESVNMGGRSQEVDEDLNLRATFTVDVHDFGTEDEEVILDDCELEDKFHEIELGEIDMFEPEDYWEGE